ncbi:MAG: cyclodeaminase/cyclohydrolase family protein [Candidatus Omnitrophica bacterium]|nr:cyclodeaminase/cyclohydrolase family protein [Candidatus Omnitrophota bacterium]
MYIKKDLKKYIDDLSSSSSVPGGGSASALTGILGMALVSMVANFNQDKKLQAQLKQLLIKNELLKNKIQVLIDRDVVVFLKLQDALKLPKEAAKRFDITQKCFKDAAEVPFEICQLCFEAVNLAQIIAKIGNVHLISDTGGAIYLLVAAYKSAELNVKINLKYIKDKKFVAKKKADMKKMLNNILKIEKQIVKKVEGCL